MMLRMKMGTEIAHILLVPTVKPLLLLLAVLPLRLDLCLLLRFPETLSVPSSKVAESRPGTSYTTCQPRVKPMLIPRYSNA